MAEAKPYRRRPHAKAKRAFMEKHYPDYYGKAKKRTKKNAATITGWVRAKAVKIVRNKRGQAVSVKIRT